MALDMGYCTYDENSYGTEEGSPVYLRSSYLPRTDMLPSLSYFIHPPSIM